MKKLRLFLDYEKEEKWLYAMAQKGWALKSVLFTYTFRKTASEDTSIRVDFRLFKHKKDYTDYITLFDDSGWQHIAGYKSIGIHYFKKTREQANENIFSDATSKAGRYKRASEMWLMMFVCYIPIIFSLYISTIPGLVSAQHASSHHSLLNDLKSLYYTPDLWQMHGTRFWQHFLFETPFVLLRTIPVILLIIFLFQFLIFAFRCRSLYKKQMHR